MNSAKVWYALTLTGYFGTFCLLIVWYGWLSPPTQIPTAFILILLAGPLLLPLRGLLHGRPYTFAWSLFLALAYFTHGVIESYSTAEDRMYAIIEVVFTLLWFASAITYIKTHPKTVAKN